MSSKRESDPGDRERNGRRAAENGDGSGRSRDRSRERAGGSHDSREGFVEIQPVTPGWARALRRQRKKERQRVTEIENYRSALIDALGRPIPLEGELRVWLDDDLVDRRAPEGWVHLRTAWEVCLILLTGRVVEISLDNDLDNRPGNDAEFGAGFQVIDFIEEVYGVRGESLWPRDGATLHTGNASGRQRMERAINGLERSAGVKAELTYNQNTQPRYRLKLPEGGSP